MKRLHTLPAAILAVLLLAALIAVFATRDSGVRTPATLPSGPATGIPDLIDTRLLATANRLATLAETVDEQTQAREALRLADHELDQAFATALREAAAYRPPATGPLRDLGKRVSQLKEQVAFDRRRVDQLAKQANPNENGELDLANAQMAVDQDELEEAQQNLARQGGDPHAALERVLQEHQGMESQTGQALKGAAARPTGTLIERARTWFALGSILEQLRDAGSEASVQSAALASQRDRLEKQTHARDPEAEAETVDTLARLSDQRKTLAELDKRIQDGQALSGVYRNWISLIETRRGSVLHLLLNSVTQIFAILLSTVLVDLGMRRLLRRTEGRRRHQARVIATVAVQALAAGLILLVFFGAPNQLSTIIGLATAGLTVVLKDFIVSFFGWFALMGKNGIRVGDWVEINGVSGEVIEIGLLKTVLLELGNWTDTGHPTGRRVAFSNSFALDRHYFNFSTAGQWLWDELKVTLPATGDPYLTAQEIRTLVEKETDADSKQAAQDWERVTNQYGARSFSPRPAVNLRPSGSGLEVTVRYITRAPQRDEVKSKLFQMIVDLMHKHT
jgi:small-conductance mechanosensitive channel